MFANLSKHVKLLSSGPKGMVCKNTALDEHGQNGLKEQDSVRWLAYISNMAFSLLQLEESEFTCAAAVKARKSMEVEIEDLHVQMEDISKAKQMVGMLLCIIYKHSDLKDDGTDAFINCMTTSFIHSLSKIK